MRLLEETKNNKKTKEESQTPQQNFKIRNLPSKKCFKDVFVVGLTLEPLK